MVRRVVPQRHGLQEVDESGKLVLEELKEPSGRSALVTCGEQEAIGRCSP